MEIVAQLRATAEAFGDEPLLVLPGGDTISLAKGYIPLLTNFTFEDRAAKGLRKRKASDKPENPVHVSALEVVRDSKIVLLSGPSGSGKTTFAKHLALDLITKQSQEPRSVFRNELGDVCEEHWDAVDVFPCYFTVDSAESLTTLVTSTLPSLIETLSLPAQTREQQGLIILDKIETIGDKGTSLIIDLFAFVAPFENIKILLLGEDSRVKHWVLPSEVARYDLLPFLKVQRQQVIARLQPGALSKANVGSGEAAATPINFALALQAEQIGDRSLDLLQSWLAVMAPVKDVRDRLVTQAFENQSKKMFHPLQTAPINSVSDSWPLLFSSSAVQRLLAAEHLVELPTEIAIALFHSDTAGSASILYSLLSRLEGSTKLPELLEGLIHGSDTNFQLGALLAADFIDASSIFKDQLTEHMSAIVAQGALTAQQRAKAGQVLSRLGDPGDLTALAHVPAGSFTLGSKSHPNSQPPHTISLGSFRIGLYPVVNQDYATFVQETGRVWQSPTGFDVNERNVPATDLSWHDATAYCAWLTTRWRSDGRIAPNETVRLPTEPEWERASRGDQPSLQDGDDIVYPWGTTWQPDAANHEETGFNTPSTVGLFPRGRSPYGCYDMAGQVWEWCSTVWGEDMATPSFGYPWRDDDGREDTTVAVADSMRRVLRGGCFSSGRLKVTCSYRGSLEPVGSWRGNGFRVVVAPVRP